MKVQVITGLFAIAVAIVTGIFNLGVAIYNGFKPSPAPTPVVSATPIPSPSSTATLQMDLEQELQQVKHNVQVWENAIFESQLRLQVTQQQQKDYEDQGRDALAKAYKKNVEILKDQIATQQRELDAAERRRSEIEALLLK